MIQTYLFFDLFHLKNKNNNNNTEFELWLIFNRHSEKLFFFFKRFFNAKIYLKNKNCWASLSGCCLYEKLFLFLHTNYYKILTFIEKSFIKKEK